MSKKHNKATPSQAVAAVMDSVAENRSKNMATLTKKNVQKNGIVTYSRPGVAASVYFNKSMFSGEPPETVEITADNLTEPGSATARAGGRNVSPERLAEMAAKEDERVKKQEERLAKSKAKAAKLAERLGKTGEQPTA